MKKPNFYFWLKLITVSKSSHAYLGLFRLFPLVKDLYCPFWHLGQPACQFSSQWLNCMVSPSHSPHWIVTGEKEAKRWRRTPWIGNVIGFQPGHDHIKMLTYTLILDSRPMPGNMWIHFSVDSEAYIHYAQKIHLKVWHRVDILIR